TAGAVAPAQIVQADPDALERRQAVPRGLRAAADGQSAQAARCRRRRQSLGRSRRRHHRGALEIDVASRREQVIEAVKALVVSALPNAEVKRNLDKPERIPPGGLVIVRDGDPGEPDVLLSPLVYVYEHRVPIEVAAFASASLSREQALDQMLSAIGTA